MDEELTEPLKYAEQLPVAQIIHQVCFQFILFKETSFLISEK